MSGLATLALLAIFATTSTLFVATSAQGVVHNLPDNVELVDPRTLGFDEGSIDLSSLLGNVKLTPIGGNTDPKTGLKTQVLTVGFDGDEPLNLEDFELPGNNSDLVQTAFQSVKNYYSGSSSNKEAGSQPQKTVPTIKSPISTSSRSRRPNIITRRRKVKQPTTTPTPPKVVELESDQIEKLLATGKLKSKKVGDSQVIEITQEQLNELYQMENGAEFKELLGVPESSKSTSRAPPPRTTIPARRPSRPTTYRPSTIPEAAPVSVSTASEVQKTTNSPVPSTSIADTETVPPSSAQTEISSLPPTTTTTQLPIIYQFSTKDLDNFQHQQQQRPKQTYPLKPNVFLGNSNRNNYFTPQVNKVIKHPTFEFISVPPVQVTTLREPANNLNNNNNNHFNNAQFPRQQVRQPVQTQPQLLRPAPTPARKPQGGGKVLFPTGQQVQAGSDLMPQYAMNTYYEEDGLNYKDNSNGKYVYLKGL